MTRKQALEEIPSILDELETLEQEKAKWLQGWRQKQRLAITALKMLRRIARGEQTIDFGEQAQEEERREPISQRCPQ